MGASRAPLTRHRRRVRVATTGLGVGIGAGWFLTPPNDPMALSVFVAVTAAAFAVGALSDRALRNADLIDEELRASLDEGRMSRRRLEEANEQLRTSNAQVVATQVAFAHLLDVADDRTGGRLRMIVEDTGEELADMLFEKIGRDGDAGGDDDWQPAA